MCAKKSIFPFQSRKWLLKKCILVYFHKTALGFNDFPNSFHPSKQLLWKWCRERIYVTQCTEKIGKYTRKNTGTFPTLVLQIFRLVLIATYAYLIHLPAPRYSSPYSCCLSGGKLPQSLLRNVVNTSPFIIPVSVAPGSIMLTWTSNLCISRLKESANASTPYLEIV